MSLIHDEERYPFSASVAGKPGDAKEIGPGAVCTYEDGRETEAQWQVVTEADSFGVEYTYMDNAMYEAYKADREAYTETLVCERCGSTDNVQERRDPEEGSSGPLYDMCGTCHSGILQSLYGDMEDEDDDNDYYYDD